MSHRHIGDDATRGFLSGDPCCVGEIREAVEAVVRCLHPENDGLREDLVQDVLMRLVGSLRADRFRGDASLKTYAQNVAKYACLEHRRSRKAQVELDVEVIPSGARWSAPEAILLQEEERRRDLEFFESIPAESQEFFRLIFVEGLSYREVGARLGITEAAIKSRVHRMRSVFRKWEKTTQRCAPTRPSTSRGGSR